MMTLAGVELETLVSEPNTQTTSDTNEEGSSE